MHTLRSSGYWWFKNVSEKKKTRKYRQNHFNHIFGWISARRPIYFLNLHHSAYKSTGFGRFSHPRKKVVLAGFLIVIHQTKAVQAGTMAIESVPHPVQNGEQIYFDNFTSLTTINATFLPRGRREKKCHIWHVSYEVVRHMSYEVVRHMSNVSTDFGRHMSNDFVRHVSYKSTKYSVRHVSYKVIRHVSYKVERLRKTRVIRLCKTRVKYATVSDFPLLPLGTFPMELMLLLCMTI